VRRNRQHDEGSGPIKSLSRILRGQYTPKGREAVLLIIGVVVGVIILQRIGDLFFY